MAFGVEEHRSMLHKGGMADGLSTAVQRKAEIACADTSLQESVYGQIVDSG